MARMASCYPWSASMSAEQFMFHQSWYVVHKSLSQTMSRASFSTFEALYEPEEMSFIIGFWWIL